MFFLIIYKLLKKKKIKLKKKSKSNFALHTNRFKIKSKLIKLIRSYKKKNNLLKTYELLF